MNGRGRGLASWPSSVEMGCEVKHSLYVLAFVSRHASLRLEVAAAAVPNQARKETADQIYLVDN